MTVIVEDICTTVIIVAIIAAAAYVLGKIFEW